MSAELLNRKIILGVSAGIAAYKACTLCRLLVRQGAQVHVVMTRDAAKLVGPATFEALSGHPVGIEVFANAARISHISLVADADLYIIAPATANTLAKLAAGLADNLLSASFLAAVCPVVVAPAMNVNMYRNAATQDNLAVLKRRGVYVISPATGDLACGANAEGRLAEPEDICDYIISLLRDRLGYAGDTLLPRPPKPLELGQTRLLPAADGVNLKILITAGPTIEDLDPVRYITNRSSGKMGYAMAEACRAAGAEVTLISGPVSLPAPDGVRLIRIRSAGEMLTAVDSLAGSHQIFIGCAAVADYRAERYSPDKIKKPADSGELTLRLVKNPDIIAAVGRRESGRPFTVGFAAETSAHRENASDKLVRKHLDLIVLNDVSSSAAGFDSDYNEVTVFDADGEVAHFPRQPKSVIAQRLAELILKGYKASGAAPQ